MKQLTGILRAGVFYEAPAWEPAPTEEQEQDDVMDDKKPTNALTARFAGLSERIEAERRKPAAPDEAIALGEARQLVETVRVLGFIVVLVDGRVQVRGAGELSAGTVERLKALREAVVRVLRSEQP